MKNRAFHFIAWGMLAAIVFVSLSPIGLRPVDLLPVNMDRMLAFALLSGLFVLAYPRYAIWVGATMIAAAGVIELLQSLSPTRHAQVEDAVVKALGALLGMVTAMAVNATRRQAGRNRRPRRPHMANADRAAWLAHMTSEPADMAKLPVTSAMIHAVYFNPEDGRLRIRFKNGEDRLFDGVPAEEALSLVTAPSPGSYYLENIRTKFRRLAA